MSERWGSFALVISLGLFNQACTGDFSQITRSLASVSGRGGLRGSSLQEIGAEAYAIHAANSLIHSHDLGYGYSYGPSIIRVDGTYHAYFCSSGTGENDWDHVRHSTSTDLLHWSEPNTLITSTLRERANCDPSVVRFDAGDGPFYYMMFSGNVRDVQTANFLARSISPNGPFLKLTDRGTWEDQPVDSRVIVGPVIATPDNSGIYGAGQASMVVRNGEVWQFYNDTTSDGPGNNNRAFLMRSRDMLNWSAPLATDALAGSFDVKFDPERNAFVMFDIDQDHSRTAHLTMRISQDGLHWTDPVVLCETGCFPNYANNIGVSGDAGGNLIPGTDFLIAYGAPYGLNSAYTNDCQQTPDNCFGNWDLAGQIVSRRAQLGILQTAGGIYFYNGNDAVCHVATMDDLTQIGIQNLQFLGVLPSSARNDGDCAIAQREGFFSNVNGIFYSNGVDAYCHVSDPDDMGNFIRMRGTADITARSSFPNMRNDGECHVPQPEGLFSNAAEGIFYSNGADAFCHVSNPDDMIVFIRARGSDRVAARSTFPNMRRDGECQVAAAEGFFSNAEGIFYSNGVDAFATSAMWKTSAKWRGVADRRPSPRARAFRTCVAMEPVRFLGSRRADEPARGVALFQGAPRPPILPVMPLTSPLSSVIRLYRTFRQSRAFLGLGDGAHDPWRLSTGWMARGRIGVAYRLNSQFSGRCRGRKSRRLSKRGSAVRSVFFGFILIFLLTGCQGGSPTAMTETSGSNERVLSSILPVASPADAPTTETGGAALTFEGADPLFGHQTGRASGLSWEADVHQLTERMLTYGPYLKSLAPGRYVARVTLMTDDNLADDESVATIDVNDAARGQVLTSWKLTRRLFADGGTPATFDLSFQAEAGANLEFRIAYHGHAYLKHIKTEVFAGDLTGSSSEGLASLLSSPRNDPFSKFSLSDDQGHGMDVLNIEQESENQLVGVYHVNQGGDRFCLRLATATAIDQAVWHNTTEIDCDYASQGTLKRLGDGKYLLAYEKNPGGKRPYIRFLLFPSFQALLANQSMREFSIPQNPQANAEGTPNFRWIRYDGNPDTMTIEIGFHFNQRRDGLDVNGIGFLRGFKSWDYYENTALNRLVREQAQGNIGGRSLIVAGGRPYTLVEAMTVKDDWSSWRLFLYDERAQTIQKLAITNTAGEHSFGNPSLALVQRGSDVLLVGSAYSFNSSQSGTHLFARKMLSSRTRPEFQVTSGPFDLSWAASALPHRIGHAESDGWAVSAGDGGGFLLYGPYDKTLPHAPLTATFSYMVDNNTAENRPVVRFEVYDATTGEIVADQTLSRRQLPAPGTWGTAQLAFDWRYRAGHAVETRVYVMGISYVKVGRVRLRDAN